MIQHHSHCALRLGDNLAALLLIRRLAKNHPDREFVHACNFGYMRMTENLKAVVEDLPNIRLVDMAQKHQYSVDLWKGANGWFYSYPNWRDYVDTMLAFYALCSVRIGLPCPITARHDLLFDYPALLKAAAPGITAVDWLVVNSPPLSGQLPGYRMDEMDALIGRLCQKHKVATTARTSHGKEFYCADHLTVTEIGALSMGARNILMVSTGPSWPTYNPWTEGNVQLRIVLLQNEIVNIGRNTIHRQSVADAHALLEAEGLL